MRLDGENGRCGQGGRGHGSRVGAVSPNGILISCFSNHASLLPLLSVDPSKLTPYGASLASASPLGLLFLPLAYQSCPSHRPQLMPVSEKISGPPERCHFGMRLVSCTLVTLCVSCAKPVSC